MITAIPEPELVGFVDKNQRRAGRRREERLGQLARAGTFPADPAAEDRQDGGIDRATELPYEPGLAAAGRPHQQHRWEVDRAAGHGRDPGGADHDVDRLGAIGSQGAHGLEPAEHGSVRVEMGLVEGVRIRREPTQAAQPGGFLGVDGVGILLIESIADSDPEDVGIDDVVAAPQVGRRSKRGLCGRDERPVELDGDLRCVEEGFSSGLGRRRFRLRRRSNATCLPLRAIRRLKMKRPFSDFVPRLYA